MKTSSILVLLGALGPGVAIAGPANPKAHLECMSGAPIKAGKPAKLDAELWCTIRVDKLGGFTKDGLVATLTPRVGKATTLKTQPGGVEVPVVDTQDGIEARLAEPWREGTHYKACEPFEVSASLHDVANRGMDDEVWSTTLKIAASCPRPKKISAKLACNYTAGDGTIFTWPGNGVKAKPRMEGPLHCSVLAGKKVDKAIAYEVSVSAKGQSAPPISGPFERDESGAAFFSATLTEEMYQACSKVTVLGAVRAAGVAVWSGTLSIAQDCPD